MGGQCLKDEDKEDLVKVDVCPPSYASHPRTT